MTLPPAADLVRQRNNVTTTGQQVGPVLLFAHGFGCDQSMWRRLVPAFAHDHRVVLFDHVGAGDSDLSAYDSAKYGSLDGYAQDVVEICDALALERVVVVAHSVSAMIALVAAISRPDLFARLVLVAPSARYIDEPDQGYVGGMSREDVDGLLASLDSNYFAWAAAMAPAVMGPDDAGLVTELERSFCRTSPVTAGEFARLTFLTDARALLPQVRTPCLVLQCTDDALAPPSVGSYVDDHLQDSRLVQLAAVGHCPHVSAPSETARTIRDYLEHPL